MAVVRFRGFRMGFLPSSHSDRVAGWALHWWPCPMDDGWLRGVHVEAAGRQTALPSAGCCVAASRSSLSRPVRVQARPIAECRHKMLPFLSPGWPKACRQASCSPPPRPECTTFNTCSSPTNSAWGLQGYVTADRLPAIAHPASAFLSGLILPDLYRFSYKTHNSATSIEKYPLRHVFIQSAKWQSRDNQRRLI